MKELGWLPVTADGEPERFTSGGVDWRGRQKTAPFTVFSEARAVRRSSAGLAVRVFYEEIEQ